MTNKTEFYCGDNESHFRLENDGRVRLVLRPEERVILVGQWNADDGVLLLFKGKTNFDKRSYMLACPSELWEGLDGIKTIAVSTRDRRRYYAVDAATFRMFGYTADSGPQDSHGQRYRFLDFENWTEVGDMADVLSFSSDKSAQLSAQKGGR